MNPEDYRTEYERVALERQSFYVRQTEMSMLIDRLSAKEVRIHRDMMTDMMVHDMVDYILAYDGGKEAIDYVTADLALRPRWFPRFLWRRMPTRRVRWEMVAKPKWIWPFANVALPEELGRPVEFMVVRTNKGDV